jgi:cysteine desulfurase
MNRIYSDAAAATPLSPAARKELVRLLDVYGNAGALHKEALEAKKVLDAARKSIAESVGAHPDEIVFTASGTEGNNLAIQGVLRPLLREQHGVSINDRHSVLFKPLHAITSAIEHQSVLEPLHALKAEGLEITELPVDSKGLVSQKDLKEAMRENTVFISIQLINSEVGTIEPIRELAKVIRRARKQRQEKGATFFSEKKVAPFSSEILPLMFHTDASQAPFWIDIKVESLGVDLLTLDAQKVQGPKGVGALYIKRSTSVESIMWGGVQEFGLRAGTPNVPLAGSFAVALSEAQTHVESRGKKIGRVRNYLWDEIKKIIPDAMLNGPSFEHRAANNLNISISGLDGETAVIALDALCVAASTRSACDTADEDPSHVIKAIGVPKDLAKTAIRFTLLPTATKADTKVIVQALKRVCDLYRKK